MGKERQTSLQKDLAYVDRPPPGRWSLIPTVCPFLPSPVGVGYAHDPLPDTRVWKGKSSNFLVEKPGKDQLSQVKKLTSPGMSCEYWVPPDT